MDARSLVATLAIVFILWLIRSWIEWDIDVKAASHSRLQLKKRLNDTILRERVGGRRSTQVQIQRDVQGTPADAFDNDNTFKGAERKTRLQEQLTELEAQAKAAGHSDLELRRLRSELNSVQFDQSSATTQIESLEVRVREQQAALEQIGQHSGTGSDSVYTQPDMSEASNEASSTDLNADEKSATSTVKKPLYQAPSDKDNLKLIKGIGPVMERTLNELGVTTFRQLANFTQVDIDKVSEAIGAFPGRIERDDWVGKAREFVGSRSAT